MRLNLGTTVGLLILVQGAAWFDGGVEADILDFETLDVAQRVVAAGWQQNDRCMDQDMTSINTAIDAGEDVGLCMAENAYDHVKRRLRVKDLVPRDVAVSPTQFKRLVSSASTEKPLPYSFLPERDQRNIQGGENIRNLVDLCKALQTTRIPEVVWPVNDSEAEITKVSSSSRDLLRRDGAVLLRSTVANDTLIARAIRYIAWKAAHANASVTEYAHETHNRHHLRLHPSEHPVVAEVFTTLVGTAGAVLTPLVSRLGAVVEFAAFLTNPGARGQHFHTDIVDSLKKRPAPLYSFFLMLTDLDERQEGALQIVPQSHALSGATVGPPTGACGERTLAH